MSDELPADLRKSLMAKVHIAKKQLGLEDEAYRDLLEKVTGKRSAKEMTGLELSRVMDEFVVLGFKVGSGKPKKLVPQTRDKPSHERTQADVIRALWVQCWKLRMVASSYDDALQRFVKRQTGCDRVEWLQPEQASGVIKALEEMKRRGEATGEGDGGV